MDYTRVDAEKITDEIIGAKVTDLHLRAMWSEIDADAVAVKQDVRELAGKSPDAALEVQCVTSAEAQTMQVNEAHRLETKLPADAADERDRVRVAAQRDALLAMLEQLERGHLGHSVNREQALAIGADDVAKTQELAMADIEATHAVTTAKLAELNKIAPQPADAVSELDAEVAAAGSE